MLFCVMETSEIDETLSSPKPTPKQLKSKGARAERDLRKYPLLPPCNSKCRLSCSERVDSGLRRQIWHKFRSGSFEERRNFLNAHVNVTGIQRRKKHS